MKSPHRRAAVAAIALSLAATSTLAAPASSSGANEHRSPTDTAPTSAARATAEPRAIVAREDHDYAMAIKACKTMPLSERTTCISRAGASRQLAARAQSESSAPGPQR